MKRYINKPSKEELGIRQVQAQIEKLLVIWCINVSSNYDRTHFLMRYSKWTKGTRYQSIYEQAINRINSKYENK